MLYQTQSNCMLKLEKERKEVIDEILKLDQTEANQIVLSCMKGNNACLIYFGIIDLLPDTYRVSVYDGSFSEWSAHLKQ